MTTSVCMATYNGAKYIETQLDSILHQTLQPDEVVFYDDGSQDGTVEIIQSYIQKHNLLSCWKLNISRENKGYPACYYHAMQLCTKDIIFLADQDDIWATEKMSKMCNIFLDQEYIQAVVCKFGLVDEKGDRIHTFLNPTNSKDTGELRKITIHDVLYKCEWPGMVMAFRRKWYLSWSKGKYKLPHDLLISAKAAEEGVFLQMDEKLANHRRHENNAGQEEHRIKKLLNKKRKLQEIKDYIQYLDAFDADNVLVTEEGKDALKRKKKVMGDRYEALYSGKRMRVIKNALANWRNVRMATVVCDVVICRQKR